MFKKPLILLAILLFLFFLSSREALAQTIAITSTSGNSVSSPYDQPTRILRHELNTLDPPWLLYNYNDSGWGSAYSVWSDVWWQELNWIPDGQFDPVTGKPNGLTVCAWCFMNRGTGAHVIQSSPNVDQASPQRDFFRKKFTIPAGKIIKKAYLYVISDNISKYWLNGTQVVGNNTSLNNSGDCITLLDGIEGYVSTFDVTSQVRTGDNLLAGSNLNWRICGQNHPMGAQFYLWLELDDAKGRVTGTVFTDNANSCNPNDSINNKIPDQRVSLFQSGSLVGGDDSDSLGLYDIGDIPINTNIYSLDAINSVGAMRCCDSSLPASCDINFSATTLVHRDIRFIPNLSWLNVYDGDVYGQEGVLVRLPSHDPNISNNWLVNKTFSQGGGAVISADRISTKQLAFADNHSSVRSNNPSDNTPPGWEVANHPAPFTYLSKFGFQNPRAIPLTTWSTILEPNTSYELPVGISPVGTYRLKDPGVATIYIDGSLTIPDDILSENADEKGLVFVVNGTVTITKSVARLDAVIISSVAIEADGESDSALTVYGGLYSRGDFFLKRIFTDPATNRVSPAITVRFQPVYLTNLNPDFIKFDYFWEELPPQ